MFSALFFSVAAAAIISKISSVQVFQHWFPQGIENRWTSLFEKDAWQFVLAFMVIIILSRGHLWSYGIRSDNLKRSMIFLAGMYGVTILFYVTARAVHLPLTAEGISIHMNDRNSVLIFLIQWMSSPVADQILFFSLVQSVLMKNNVSHASVFGIHLHFDVLIAALLFALLHAGIPLTEIPELNFIAACVVGIFSGYVYKNTTSVLTPMLGQAFFYGFPFFMKLLHV